MSLFDGVDGDANDDCDDEQDHEDGAGGWTFIRYVLHHVFDISFLDLGNFWGLSGRWDLVVVFIKTKFFLDFFHEQRDFFSTFGIFQGDATSTISDPQMLQITQVTKDHRVDVLVRIVVDPQKFQFGVESEKIRLQNLELVVVQVEKFQLRKHHEVTLGDFLEVRLVDHEPDDLFEDVFDVPWEVIEVVDSEECQTLNVIVIVARIVFANGTIDRHAIFGVSSVNVNVADVYCFSVLP
jgi:hypothetical protein